MLLNNKSQLTRSHLCGQQFWPKFLDFLPELGFSQPIQLGPKFRCSSRKKARASGDHLPRFVSGFMFDELVLLVALG
jgi:hypothetical protein